MSFFKTFSIAASLSLILTNGASANFKLAQDAENSGISYDLKVDSDYSSYTVVMKLVTKVPVTTFRIPVWTPGYYHIENFQTGISQVEAKDSTGSSLEINHTNSYSWAVSAPSGTLIKFVYHVKATDPGLGFFGCMLNHRVGFVNGASTYMYVTGRETEPDTLHLEVPTGWKIESTLDKNSGEDFFAPTGYDEFIDSPLQLGTFDVKRFMVRNVPFKLVLVSKNGSYLCDVKDLERRLQAVSAPALDMFGDHSFKHYTYFIHFAVGNFAGGLEHRAGTCIAISDDPHLDIDSIAAHENFHAWNVKQIRPKVLGPFDYTQPDRTDALWFSEGVTDYYADILTARSGLKNQDWLFQTFQDQINGLNGSQDKKTYSVADASRKSWDADGFGFGDLSFYTKGLLAGLIFDASIRAHTRGEKSLDDVMRLMYSKYKLPNPGFEHDGILDAMNTVLGVPHGMDNLYHTLIDSTDKMPYEILHSIGIDPGEGENFAGSLPYTVDSGVVTTVGSVAIAQGLKVGDKVLSTQMPYWDGIDPRPTSIKMTVQSGTVTKSLEIPLTYSEGIGQTAFKLDSNATAEQKKLAKQWLQNINN